MVLLHTPVCDFNTPAIDFTLKDPLGKTYSLNDCRGPKGLLVMFICNHCPYVRAIIFDLAKDVSLLKEKGIGSVAIMSNDYKEYPEDSPENMIQFGQQHQFTFPYLIDETQEVARAYGAVCTPDFFGYNHALELQYRGRFAANPGGTTPVGDGKHELLLAMQEIAQTGKGPQDQTASMGCSIKWISK